MKDSFPADFYVAGATVIPVLFLALLVQSPALEQLMQAAKTFFATSHGRFPPGPAIFVYLASLGLIYGIVGEMVALNELIYQHDSMFPRTLVASSVFLLLIGVAAVPVFAIFGPVFRETARLMRKDMNGKAKPQARGDQAQGH
jgi:hypothetical protein